MPPDSEVVAAVLADVASLGPYFALQAAGADWPAWSALTGGGPALAEHVAATAAALGRPGGPGVEARVVVSVAQLGLLARVLAPLVGVALLHRLVLGPDPDAVRCRPRLGGPYPLAIPVAAVRSATAAATVEETAGRLAGAVLTPLAAPLVAAAARLTPVAPGLLRGNVASAVAGAAAAVAAARPDRAADARALTAALLDRPPLTGTGTVRAGRFRRRSCCLLYRTGTGLCGDCALAG